MLTDIAARLTEAQRLQAEGADGPAVLAYQELLRLAPDLTEANQGLWEILFKAAEVHFLGGNFDEALYFAGLALARKPDDSQTRRLIGLIKHRQSIQLFHDRKVEEAEPLMREAYAMSGELPQIGDALVVMQAELAVILNQDGEWHRPLGLLREASQLRPDNQEVRTRLFTFLVNYAIVFHNNCQFTEALQVIEQALALDPAAEWPLFFRERLRHLTAEDWSLEADGVIKIPYLEMDITYLCNLHCDGCTHYSDYTVKGHVDFEQGRDWLTKWSRHIHPKLFRLVGGEPTLNPQLMDYIRFVHKLWPLATRELVSNGFFINRHPGIFELLAETRTGLQISVHDEEPDFLAQVQLDKLKEASVKYGFSLHAQYGTADDFYRLYKGKGKSMRPFNDGDPLASMSVCGNSDCYTLHLGRLWKCPPIAFLNNIEERFKLNEVPEWQPYLQHKGLSLDASPEEIRDYLGPPQYFCGMCPSQRQGGSNRTRYEV